MKKRWQYRIAHYWDMPDANHLKEARVDSAKFEHLLNEGWEPRGGWHGGGSMWHHYVIMRRQKEKPRDTRSR